MSEYVNIARAKQSHCVCTPFPVCISHTFARKPVIRIRKIMQKRTTKNWLAKRKHGIKSQSSATPRADGKAAYYSANVKEMVGCRFLAEGEKGNREALVRGAPFRSAIHTQTSPNTPSSPFEDVIMFIVLCRPARYAHVWWKSGFVDFIF